METSGKTAQMPVLIRSNQTGLENTVKLMLRTVLQAQAYCTFQQKHNLAEKKKSDTTHLTGSAGLKP